MAKKGAGLAAPERASVFLSNYKKTNSLRADKLTRPFPQAPQGAPFHTLVLWAARVFFILIKLS